MKLLSTLQNFTLHVCMVLMFLSSNIQAQQTSCPQTSNQTLLDANNINAILGNRGTLFFDGSDAGYQIVSENQTPATIFAQGLWIGGYGEDGSLRLSAQTYGHSNNTYDYEQGPILVGADTDPDFCTNWNKTWSVYRHQIETHIADYADNGMIDDPIPAIMGWPGRANPSFEAYEGWALPPNVNGYAPFWDVDSDGVYNPSVGDYPYLFQVDGIPEQITWSVFNTAGEHNSSGGLSSNLEIQLTSWAFNCSDSELLNHTTFHSYKIINRAIGNSFALDSLFIGLWHDVDLGCYLDDYTGSYPAANTFFAYNQNNTDEPSCSGVPGFGDQPPVQAVTFLNQDLSKFISINNSSVAPNPPATTSPETAAEYYHYLNGAFRDGTPLTEGGNGYNPGSTDYVDHIFPGNPNNNSEWSQYAVDLLPGDRRALGSTFIGTMSEGATVSLDVAYSYHRNPGASHIENVDFMYDRVAELQGLYDNQFSDNCTLAQVCENDCIWAGDMNADGIANHCDLLSLGHAYGETDITRTPPLSWTPQSGTNWANNQPNSANNKHIDANGDGVIDEGDFLLTLNHYLFTHSNYQANDVYQEGPELVLERLGSEGFDALEAGESFLGRLRLTESIPDLAGLAFSIEYDPVYFSKLALTGADYDASSGQLKFRGEDNDIGQLDYALYNIDGSNINEGTFEVFSVQVQQQLPTSAPSNSSLIRFKNIKAILSDGTEIEIGGQTIEAIFPGVMVGAQEPNWANNLKISPNPFNKNIAISLPENRLTHVKMTNAIGALVYQAEINSSFYQLNTERLHLPNGVYFLQFIRENEIVSRKVVKH